MHQTKQSGVIRQTLLHYLCKPLIFRHNEENIIALKLYLKFTGTNKKKPWNGCITAIFRETKRKIYLNEVELWSVTPLIILTHVAHIFYFLVALLVVWNGHFVYVGIAYIGVNYCF